MKRMLVVALMLFLIIIKISISAAPSSTFPKETKYFDRLAANDEQFMLISNTELLFTKVGVETNKDITRAKLTVQAMPDCPENAPYQTDVLQCFVITSSNFQDDDVASAEIHFKVPKEWMDANNYKNVELRRYSYSWNNGAQLSQWRSLNTVFESENENYYYYESDSDGFSYFSIVGKEDGEIIDTNIINENNNIINNNEIIEAPREERPEQITVQAPQPKKSSSNPIWIFAAVLAAASIVVSFVLHKKEINNYDNNNNDKISELEPIVEYIKSVEDCPEDQVRNMLEDFGWKDWQIELAFNQAKLKKSQEEQ